MDTTNCKCDETEQKILQIVRVVAPDLVELSDNMLLALINLHKHHVSKSRFGEFYYEAVAYYVAHKAALHQLIAANGADNGSVVGGITSEHEGDLSRSYGSGGSGVHGYTDTLDKTIYGLEFKRIRDMCIVPMATRFW